MKGSAWFRSDNILGEVDETRAGDVLFLPCLRGGDETKARTSRRQHVNPAIDDA